MTKPRGRSHTTLTQTASMVVRIIKGCAGVKMIAPGEISASRSSSRRITITHTSSGLQLTVSGQGIQRIAVHTTDPATNRRIINAISQSKPLRDFIIAEREMRPGI